MQSHYVGYHGWNVLAVAVDLREHGRSKGPRLATVEAMADWTFSLADILKDTMQLQIRDDEFK